MRGFPTWLIGISLTVLPFDMVKDWIAEKESHNGIFKIHINVNATLDAGRFQINSRHFFPTDSVGRECDRIFKRWGVKSKLHDRVVAAIVNDSLNEDLARAIFNAQGISAWMSARNPR